MTTTDLTVTAGGRTVTVAYESFDPGDPGKWVARVDGKPVASNTRLLSTDREGARDWGYDVLEWLAECKECDCATEAPYDPNDPGAYPGPPEDCECECHQ